MKKMFVSILVAFLLLVPVGKVLAQGQGPLCTDIHIDPSSGTNTTIFTLTATCNPVDAQFNILIYDENGDPTNLAWQVVSSGNTLQAPISLGGSYPPGDYEVFIVFAGDQAGETTLSIKEPTTNEPPSTGVCCTVRHTSLNFCSSLPSLKDEAGCASATEIQNCPSNCPSVQGSLDCPTSAGANYYFCAGLPNSTADVVAGNCPGGKGWADTAIGCIPYTNIDQTTQFFLRWALGIGGGIALFMISVSAIRIMTVRDDQKMLQDARDTLTAAVMGLVLIALSVFLVRFISQTLLSLF